MLEKYLLMIGYILRLTLAEIFFYDDQTRKVHDVSNLLTNPEIDNKQDDEQIDAGSSPPSTRELPKRSVASDKQGGLQDSSNDETALSSKQERPFCWQIKNVKSYEITLLLLVLICHLSLLVGGQTPCVYSTKDFRVLKQLKPNEICESILRHHFCENGYVKACIRDHNHSSLVAVCTKNICLNNWACAEYQQLNTPVITSRPKKCLSCSNTTTLEDRMKTAKGEVCLKLTPHLTPQPTTAPRNQAAADPQTSMADINLIVGLIILAGMKHLC